MRWQKTARLLVAAVGLATAVAVYVLTRERPAPAPPVVADEPDREAKMQAGAGEDHRYKGDELVGTLTYSEVRSYDNKRVVWRGFRYRLKDGSVLSADQAEARGTAGIGDKPEEIVLTGSVRMEDPADELLMTGDAATFNETTGQAEIPGPTSITRGRLTGNGTGGMYDRETGVFRLLENVTVRIVPEAPSDVPLEATSKTATFTPDVKAMLFEGGARLSRRDETLRGERATLYLTQDESQVRLIELRGQAAVEPVAGRASDLPEMHARDIDLAFYEGRQALEHGYLSGNAVMHQPSGDGRRSIEAGEIRFRTAPDGTTLTRLDATPEGRGGRITVRLPAGAGAPSRTITGARLAAGGDDAKGLTAAAFDGGVEFLETAAGRAGRAATRRVGKARRLTLAVKGQLDAIEEARFDQDVVFTADEVEGYGEVGTYRASAGELDLQPASGAAGKRASVINKSAGVTVDATELITVYLDTSNLFARGMVTTASSGSKTKSSATSIFNASDRIIGSGTEFRYDDAASRAEYRGDTKSQARLQQGRSLVIADRIEFDRDSQDLRASGRVDSTFDIATSGGRGRGGAVPSGSHRVLADALVYTEALRTAHYAGAVRLRSAEGQSKGETSAEAMDLILAGDARELERLDATGKVHAVLENGQREARGERLVYHAREDLYELWGKPLSILNRETDGTCYAQEGNVARFRGELGAPDFPAAENADGGAPRRSVPCPAAPPR
jgi:lipopolysaccharide export system protein LptA